MICEVRRHRNAITRAGELTYIAMDTVLRVADLWFLAIPVPGKNIDKTCFEALLAPITILKIYRYRIH